MSLVFREVNAEEEEGGKDVYNKHNDQGGDEADDGILFKLLAVLGIGVFFHSGWIKRLPFAFQQDDARAEEENKDDTAEIDDVAAVDDTFADGGIMVLDTDGFDVVSEST